MKRALSPVDEENVDARIKQPPHYSRISFIAGCIKERCAPLPFFVGVQLFQEILNIE